MQRFLLALGAALTMAGTAQAAPGLAQLASLQPKTSCQALAGVDVAKAVGAPVSALSASEVAGDKPYCKVTGTIAPKINFEVRLPTKAWTQRFLQTGCGGLCGNVHVSADKARGCAPVTNGEIALASTDMGHQGNDMGWGANPQQREDFAHRGVHVTSVAAKALIAAFYRQAPRYSYFSGCSDGGREALMAAQRYPGDYDGIAAGAPALNFTVQNSFYHGWMAFSNQGGDGKPILNSADMPTLRSAALAKCDALDGLKDGQITDPRQCKFDPVVTLCKAAYEPGKCLTAPQVAAARKLYDGPRDEKGRRLTAGGPMPGSEMGWPGVFVPRQEGGSIFGERIALETINNLLWTPNPVPPITLASFKFTSGNFASMANARKLYNADNANLSPFAARGGKVLLWHGWNDQHISPMNSIDYFNSVGTAMGGAKRDSILRMFLLPDVGHCSGGDGPSDFPLLQTLMEWVEGGGAPDMVFAQRAAATMEGLPGPGAPATGMSSPVRPGGPPPSIGPGGPRPALTGPPQEKFPPRSRPIYAYPKVAKYKGSGSVDDAANFKPAVAPLTAKIGWAGARQ